MKSYEKYYRESLYPFQDGVLKRVNAAETPFYLSGGTALSRHYFDHRFSDDLDFFVNHDPKYSIWVRQVYDQFEQARHTQEFFMDHDKIMRGDDYTRIFLYQNDYSLKIELINDVAPHFGDNELSPVLGPVDSWRNILSNKLTALGRLEIKDFVDIWTIATHKLFDWRQIFYEAKQKDAGLDLVQLYELLSTVPHDSLQLIKWVQAVDPKGFKHDMNTIANDLMFGHNNSLCK